MIWTDVLRRDRLLRNKVFRVEHLTVYIYKVVNSFVWIYFYRFL